MQDLHQIARTSLEDQIFSHSSKYAGTSRVYSTPSSPIEEAKDPLASLLAGKALRKEDAEQECALLHRENTADQDIRFSTIKRGSLPIGLGRRPSLKCPHRCEGSRKYKDVHGLRERTCSLNQDNLRKTVAMIGGNEPHVSNTVCAHEVWFTNKLQLSKAPLASSRSAIARLHIAVRGIEEQAAPVDAKMMLQRSNAKGKGHLYDEVETSLVSELDVMFADSSSLMRTNTNNMLLAQVSSCTPLSLFLLLQVLRMIWARLESNVTEIVCKLCRVTTPSVQVPVLHYQLDFCVSSRNAMERKGVKMKLTAVRRIKP